MRTLSLDQWVRYRDILMSLNQKAAEEFRDAVWKKSGRWKGVGLGGIPRDDLIEYAYALVNKYGDGAAEAACQFYDAIAALSGVSVPPAIPSDPPSVNEVGKVVNGAIKQSQNESVVTGAIGRLVKQRGQDTTMQNALRDGAETAWIPNGDTCAFCMTLASRGWQPVTKKTLKNGHAEHIHANCDCAYGVRFSSNFNVQGYDPEEYEGMYYQADGDTPKERINAMRRDLYYHRKDKINAQKREAYAKRKEAEEAE